MGFFFVKSGWDAELDSALRKDNSEFRIVCPFIKKAAAARLLDRGKPQRLLVITRASLDDFYTGVNDIEALKLLLENGAQIRVVRNLHTKLYIFGNARVILTSANLTDKALRSNHEFGFVADSRTVVRDCTAYFAELWAGSGRNITNSKLTKWQHEVAKHKAKAGGRSRPGLPDYGTQVDQFSEPRQPPLTGGTGQAFIKFFGEGHNRATHASSIFEEVKRSGSHWACTYPKNKRPRNVRDGDLMFMARFVGHPRDALVYGRAVGMQHQAGCDKASQADIKKRPWKSKWPNYVRVHNPEFIRGVLSNGVSLSELMNNLGSDSFASTQHNAARGRGNTDPTHAFRQHASVRLSREGAEWVSRELEEAFRKHGKMGRSELSKLDWPVIKR